jgi:hypothetical protein
LKEPYKTATFSKLLAEDLQQLLLEITLHPDHIKLLPDLDVEKEWQKSVNELIGLDIDEEIQRIQQELDSLDEKNEKSAADEVRQAELLRKVVQLRARSKQ